MRFTLIFLVILFFLFPLKSQAIILGSNNPFCSNVGEVICNENFKPVCSNSSFKPVCLNGVPNCCNENFIPSICDISQITCQFASQIKPGSAVDVEILKGPLLPEIFKSSSGFDKFEKITGIAYSGSNPSFEINIKTEEENLEILSVDLQDASGNVFKNIPFKVIDKPENSKIKILTLSLPSLTSGGASFTLNLKSSSVLSGLIEVLDFFIVQVPDKINALSEPTISNIQVKRKKKNLVFNIEGENFIGDEIIVSQAGSEEKVVHLASKEFPNTTITLFPSDLKLKLLSLTVPKNGNFLKARFLQTGKITKNTNAVIVVATPRGIVSKTFILKK